MLPSRGLIRSSPSLGLARASLQRTLPRTGASSRLFSTVLQTGKAPSSAQYALRRARIAGSPIALAASSQYVPSSLQQARYASTQPAAAGSPAPAAPVVPEVSSLEPAVSSTPVELSGSDLLDIPEQIGFLKTLGLEYGWGPTSMMQWFIEHAYVYTGLPWWAVLVLTAVGMRAVLFKPTITANIQQKILQDLSKNPRYEAARKEMTASVMGGKDGLMGGAEARNIMSRMQKDAGYSMAKTLGPMLSIPITFGMFRLLRGMAELPVASMETGGILWFTDLTVADPYYILPLLGSLAIAQAMKASLPYMQPQQAAIMRMVAFVVTPISLIATAYFPAGLQLFLAWTASLHGLQSWLMFKPWFRRFFGMPPLTKPSANTTNGTNWQPPRVLDPSIPRVALPAEPVAEKNETMYESFKKGLETAREKYNAYVEKSDVKSETSAARKYDEKRALEDKERLIARRRAKQAARRE